MLDDNVKIFSGPRRSGRTTAILAWAREVENRVIVVPNEQQRRHLYEKMHETGKIDVLVRSHGSWLSHPLNGPVEIGVDNYDQIAGESLNFSSGLIKAVTLESSFYRNLPKPLTYEDALSGLLIIEKNLR